MSWTQCSHALPLMDMSMRHRFTKIYQETGLAVAYLRYRVDEFLGAVTGYTSRQIAHLIRESITLAGTHSYVSADWLFCMACQTDADDDVVVAIVPLVLLTSLCRFFPVFAKGQALVVVV